MTSIDLTSVLRASWPLVILSADLTSVLRALWPSSITSADVTSVPRASWPSAMAFGWCDLCSQGPVTFSHTIADVTSVPRAPWPSVIPFADLTSVLKGTHDLQLYHLMIWPLSPGPRDPVFGARPRLLQHGGCGQRGRELLLPFDGLVQDRNLSSEFGKHLSLFKSILTRFFYWQRIPVFIIQLFHSDLFLYFQIDPSFWF